MMGKREAVSSQNSLWAKLTSPESRKFQVAVVGVILSLVTAGLIPPEIGLWVNAIVAGLTAAGVYMTPNKSKVEPVPVVEETQPKG